MGAARRASFELKYRGVWILMNDHDHSTVERDGAIRQRAPSVLGGAVMDAENTGVIGSCLPLLRIRDVSVRFGGVVALDKVSFDVEAGQICGLIGPNGAGKSTLFNCLSRLYDCNEGSVEVGGISTLSKPKHEIAHMERDNVLGERGGQLTWEHCSIG